MSEIGRPGAHTSFGVAWHLAVVGGKLYDANLVQLGS